MTILLDTHAFLWWITDDPQLSGTAQALIRDPQNTLLLSAASAWEIAIKVALGKLPLPEPPDVYVPRQMALNRVSPLSISMEHSLGVFALPMHHRDPFDRILIAQSRSLNIPLLSADPLVKAYPVRVIW